MSMSNSMASALKNFFMERKLARDAGLGLMSTGGVAAIPSAETELVQCLQGLPNLAAGIP